MKRVIFGMGLLFFVVCPIAEEPEIKGKPEDLRNFLHPKENIISIEGEAEEKAYSDRAVVSIVITTEDKMLSKSIDLNSQLRDTITTKLVNAGIDSKNIRSSKFSTSPQYGWFGKKPDKYQVINKMVITISDEAHLKSIAYIADSHEEIELTGTTFEHSLEDEFKNKVKTKALVNVLKQKDIYEKNLGITLKTIGFREAQGVRKAAPQDSRTEFTLNEIVVTAERRNESRRPSPSVKGRSEPDIASFDEILYRAKIYVDFQLETKNDE